VGFFNFIAEAFDGIDTPDKQMTFFFACVGFGVSIINLAINVATIVFKWIGGRRKIRATIVDFDSRCVAFHSSRFLNLIMSIRFENPSDRHIAISSIALHGESVVNCIPIPQFAGTIRNTIPTIDGDPLYLRYLESPMFPINVSPHTATQEYIVFQLPHDYSINSLYKIGIQTSSGSVAIGDHEQVERVRTLLRTSSSTVSRVPQTNETPPEA